MASWKELLNELDRDAAKEQPEDVIQWGADWFQARLRKDVSQVMVTSCARTGTRTHYATGCSREMHE
jgi:hypothetical protein